MSTIEYGNQIKCDVNRGGSLIGTSLLNSRHDDVSDGIQKIASEYMHIVDPLAYCMKVLALERLEIDEGINKRDEKVLRLLNKYRNIAKRKKLIPFASDIDSRLIAVSQRYPHAKAAIDEVSNMVSLARLDSGCARVPHMLFVGPPGSGKTTLAKSLAGAVWGNQRAVHDIYFPSIAGGFEIAGGDPQWESADAGRIAKILANSDQANVLFIADEVDKSGFESGRYGSPTVALYQLLEEHSSRDFTDVGLDGLRIDCSACSWILTANHLERIPEAIVSRCHVINVGYPEKAEEITIVIRSIWKDMRDQSSWGVYFSESLGDDVIEMLTMLPPREVKHALRSAAGRAVMRNVNVAANEKCGVVELHRILPEDVRVSGRARCRGMGFVW